MPTKLKSIFESNCVLWPYQGPFQGEWRSPLQLKEKLGVLSCHQTIKQSAFQMVRWAWLQMVWAISLQWWHWMRGCMCQKERNMGTLRLTKPRVNRYELVLLFIKRVNVIKSASNPFLWAMLSSHEQVSTPFLIVFLWKMDAVLIAVSFCCFREDHEHSFFLSFFLLPPSFHRMYSKQGCHDQDIWQEGTNDMSPLKWQEEWRRFPRITWD